MENGKFSQLYSESIIRDDLRDSASANRSFLPAGVFLSPDADLAPDYPLLTKTAFAFSTCAANATAIFTRSRHQEGRGRVDFAVGTLSGHVSIQFLSSSSPTDVNRRLTT